MQITLAVTLLIGAGLLLRSFQQLSRVFPGFDPAHVLTFQISGSWGETTNMGKVVQRIDRSLDAIRSIPGVEAASTTGMLPGVPALYQMEFKIDGKLQPGHPILADNRLVAASYFDTMRIPLLVGEMCRPSNTSLGNARNSSSCLGIKNRLVRNTVAE